jgi:hypothetical protein
MSSNTLGPLLLMAPKFAQHVSFFIFFKKILNNHRIVELQFHAMH